MKYEIGDRVEIKRRKDYNPLILEILQKINYIVTIKDVSVIGYRFKETEHCHWEEYFIKGLVLSTKEFFEPITNRFELMEL